MKIRNFRHKGLEAFSKTGALKGILPSHADRLRECFRILELARSADDFSRSAHRMSKGSKLCGLWAMKVSAQWRLVFGVDSAGMCCDVDYQNYHH